LKVIAITVPSFPGDFASDVLLLLAIDTSAPDRAWIILSGARRAHFERFLHRIFTLSLNFKENQHLFQRESHFKRNENSKYEKGVPVQHKKELFLLCHIVVVDVKIILRFGRLNLR
jgi:hypothetical protein